MEWEIYYTEVVIVTRKKAVSGLEQEKREAKLANFRFLVGTLTWGVGTCSIWTVLHGDGPLWDWGWFGYVLMWEAVIVYAMTLYDVSIDYRQWNRPANEVDYYPMFIRSDTKLGEAFQLMVWLRVVLCLPTLWLQERAQDRQDKRQA